MVLVTNEANLATFASVCYGHAMLDHCPRAKVRVEHYKSAKGKAGAHGIGVS